MCATSHAVLFDTPRTEGLNARSPEWADNSYGLLCRSSFFMVSDMQRPVKSKLCWLTQKCVWVCVLFLFGVLICDADELALTPNTPIDQVQNRHIPLSPTISMLRQKACFGRLSWPKDSTRNLDFVGRLKLPLSMRPVSSTPPQSRSSSWFICISTSSPSKFSPSVTPRKRYQWIQKKPSPQTLITMEDESGYLKLSSPLGGWKPGKYKVEIHVGEAVNNISLVGTMRFSVAANPNQEAHSEAFSKGVVR